MLSRRRSLCSALAALAFGTAGLLVGCTSPEASAATTCTTPGVSTDQIDLGVLYPDTGPAAENSDAVLGGIDARLGEVNAAGGVHGRRVVYRWRDDKGSPQENAAAAHDLVERQEVFGLIELSVAAAGSAGYLAERGIPVTGLANDQVWSTTRNMFAFSYATGAAVDTYGRYVRSQGGRRAVIVQVAQSLGISDLAQKYARSLTAQGVSVVDTVNFTTGLDHPGQAATRIAAAEADTIIGLIRPDSLISILNVLRQAGMTPKVVLSNNGYDKGLLRTFGAQAAGITVPLVYRPLELGGPAPRAYLEAMSRYAPQVAEPEIDAAVIAYINTDIFLEGLRLAGTCPTREGFVNALRAVNSYDAGGMISPISFRSSAARPAMCYSFVQVNGAGSGFLVVEPALCGSELSD